MEGDKSNLPALSNYKYLNIELYKKLKPQRHRGLKEFIEITHPLGSWRRIEDKEQSNFEISSIFTEKYYLC